jgi:hypothetical protein
MKLLQYSRYSNSHYSTLKLFVKCGNWFQFDGNRERKVLNTRYYRNWDASADTSGGTRTVYGLDGRARSSSPGGIENVYFSMSCRPALGPTQPPIQWVPRAVSSGVKRSGYEPDHSPTSVEDKKTPFYATTHPLRLYGIVFNYKNRGNLICFKFLYFYERNITVKR